MRLFFVRRFLAGLRRTTSHGVHTGRSAGRTPVREVAGALAVAAAALGGSAAPAGAASVYYGALVDGKAPTSTELSSGAFAQFESQAGKKVSMVHWGQPWKMNGALQPFPTTYMSNVRAHGSIPVLNWCSWELGKGASQPDFQLRDIYNGAYDTYLTQWATAAKNWGKPFMLRFNHEMNGWWYPWGEGRTSTGAIVNGNSAGDFKRAWQHVRNVFTRVGATNVTWVWSPNIQSTSSQYPALSTLYPGDSYVDWTGLSAYNKDPSNWLGINSLLTGAGASWLRNSYQDLLNVAPRKPMMLAETGSVEAGDGGTKKAAWITDLLSTQLPSKFPALKAFLWFDWADEGYETLPIDSSWAAQSAFKTGVASSVYATNTFGAISSSPIPPLASTTTTTPTTTTGSAALPAVADTYVSSAAPSSTAGGTTTQLQSDADPAARTYLRFDLSSLAGKTIKSAKLRFKTTGDQYAGSANSHPIRLVTDTAWKEAYMSYSNSVPVSSTTLGTIGTGTAANTAYEITVSTAEVQKRAGSLMSMAVVANGADALYLGSRESTYKPQLVVGY